MATLAITKSPECLLEVDFHPLFLPSVSPPSEWVQLHEFQSGCLQGAIQGQENALNDNSYFSASGDHHAVLHASFHGSLKQSLSCSPLVNYTWKHKVLYRKPFRVSEVDVWRSLLALSCLLCRTWNWTGWQSQKMPLKMGLLVFGNLDRCMSQSSCTPQSELSI